MTLSPVENAHLSTTTLAAFVRSERLVLAGGIVTGPLFGWFGHQWRVRRARLGAVITALAICLEPAIHIPAHRGVEASSVWLAEVCVGVLAVSYFAIAGRHRRPVTT
jgi:hypothetical protein